MMKLAVLLLLLARCFAQDWGWETTRANYERTGQIFFPQWVSSLPKLDYHKTESANEREILTVGGNPVRFDCHTLRVGDLSIPIYDGKVPQGHRCDVGIDQQSIYVATMGTVSRLDLGASNAYEVVWTSSYASNKDPAGVVFICPSWDSVTLFSKVSQAESALKYSVFESQRGELVHSEVVHGTVEANAEHPCTRMRGGNVVAGAGTVVQQVDLMEPQHPKSRFNLDLGAPLFAPMTVGMDDTIFALTSSPASGSNKLNITLHSISSYGDAPTAEPMWTVEIEYGEKGFLSVLSNHDGTLLMAAGKHFLSFSRGREDKPLQVDFAGSITSLVVDGNGDVIVGQDVEGVGYVVVMSGYRIVSKHSVPVPEDIVLTPSSLYFRSGDATYEVHAPTVATNTE